jgi:hypothetical protein
MPADDLHSHSASIEVAVDPQTAFEYMASGMNQSRWALGSWERADHGDGLFSGTSLWDASTLYVRLEPHPELLLVDYQVGKDPGELRRLTQARIIPGEVLGRDPQSCVITLTTWRGAAHSDASWTRTYHAYKTEMHLIKGRLENEFPAGV